MEFYLPPELQRLIQDFARPLTRPDWRQGGSTNRKMKFFNCRLLDYYDFDTQLGNKYRGEYYCTAKELELRIGSINGRFYYELGNTFCHSQEDYDEQIANHELKLENIEKNTVLCDDNGRRIFTTSV